MPFVKVAKAEEIPPGTKKSIKVSKTRVLVVNVDGKFYATQSICSHLSNPLFTGKLQGKKLWCDMHYAAFDVTTGAILELPPGYESDKVTPLKTYAVKTDGSDILVDVPE